MAEHETQLDGALHWEKTTPDRVWLTQPHDGGQITEFTWKEAMDKARRLATWIEAQDLPDTPHIAIFSNNTAWWMIADLAIMMAGGVSVPLYATLTPETIRQIIEHGDVAMIMVGKLKGYEEMRAGIPDDLPGLELPLAPKTSYPTFEEVVAASEPKADPVRRDKDELATIIYTSGSTGQPKGVMHSFHTMTVSAVGIQKELGVRPDDRMLSYLPLAHGFERWALQTNALTAGFSVWFAESLETFVTDLKRARPTLFVSVPRLWQKFQLGVFEKMPPGRLSFLLKIPFVNTRVRQKILGGLGLDAVRFAGSGSAPIPGEVIDWYRNLGLELLEGYGMSENFSYSHVSRPGKVRVGYVGSPYPGVESRITEEGEIQVKSPGNMLGYYKMQELTAEVLPADGFLKTGDRGEVDEEGRLKITGRVKEIFKTSKGKYVSPAPIENKLLLHDDVELALVGGTGFPQPHGLVVLSDQARGDATARKGELVTSLEAHLDKVNAELDHHENLDFVAVITEPWTVENGLLTPTMKLKRSAIEDRYGTAVPSWYDRKQRVVWVDAQA